MSFTFEFEALSSDQRTEKLQPFLSYYNPPQNSGFKSKRIPYWMDTYGYWLNRESDRGLPKYYRIFERGTIVMVDFGVQIASEFSGPHFAVVLNRKDTKFNSVITVVPLSSKEKSWYANLGNEVLSRILDRYQQMQSQLVANLETLEHRYIGIQTEFSAAHIHHFSKSETLVLSRAGMLDDHG